MWHVNTPLLSIVGLEIEMIVASFQYNAQRMEDYIERINNCSTFLSSYVSK